MGVCCRPVVPHFQKNLAASEVIIGKVRPMAADQPGKYHMSGVASVSAQMILSTTSAGSSMLMLMNSSLFLKIGSGSLYCSRISSGRVAKSAIFFSKLPVAIGVL